MLKDEQCKKLAHVQEQMSVELEELTAKLFEVSQNLIKIFQNPSKSKDHIPPEILFALGSQRE